jgi:hypothetical protein
VRGKKRVNACSTSGGGRNDVTFLFQSIAEGSREDRIAIDEQDAQRLLRLHLFSRLSLFSSLRTRTIDLYSSGMARVFPKRTTQLDDSLRQFIHGKSCGFRFTSRSKARMRSNV